jgi:hypothetical protein
MVRGNVGRIRDFNREIEASFRSDATFVAIPAMREPSADLDSYFDRDGIHPNLRGARYIAKAIAGEIALQAHGAVPERMAADQQ